MLDGWTLEDGVPATHVWKPSATGRYSARSAY
uniref:Uncharacterized protein n=1 Tax=Arundo donax TaxID=35708 RepID=A0A0A9C807_ARUDO